MGAGAFRLGGGTALAALWGHRHSTDVDLFADHAAYAELTASESRVRLLSERLRDALQPDEMEIRRGTLKIVCVHGELARNPADAVSVVRKLLSEDAAYRLRRRLVPDSPAP